VLCIYTRDITLQRLSIGWEEDIVIDDQNRYRQPNTLRTVRVGVKFNEPCCISVRKANRDQSLLDLKSHCCLFLEESNQLERSK